jgi:hypothetical protein
MAYKGRFKPSNAQKYLGDPTNIIYRSLWELKLMRKLDCHPQVIHWASEEIAIPYRSPIDGKRHRYFPDFYIKQINNNGVEESILVEVKPKSQTSAPQKSSKVTKKYLNEVATWGVNQAKWNAAESYCADRGWKFMIMTEKELGIK